MKKLSVLLLAAAMALSLAACGGGDDSGTSTVVSPSPSPSASESAQPESPASGDLEIREVVVTVPAFSIQVNGVEITNESMADYAVYEIQTSTVNSAGTASTATYAGFALSDVLAAAGVTDYESVTATADDGYAVEVSAEVAAAPSTLVAVTKDGAQFSGSPWFAPCSSGTTGDYLKGMVAITLDGAPAQLPAEPAESGEPSGGGESAPEIQDKTDKVTFEAFSFKVNGAEVTNETLDGLHIYKIDATATNSKGESSTSTYTGYRLSDVLAAAGVTDYTTVKAVANDGYETELALESANSEYTLVAIEKDKELGEDGTIWVAPCLEESSSAYCKLVVEIVAE